MICLFSSLRSLVLSAQAGDWHSAPKTKAIEFGEAEENVRNPWTSAWQLYLLP